MSENIQKDSLALDLLPGEISENSEDETLSEDSDSSDDISSLSSSESSSHTSSSSSSVKDKKRPRFYVDFELKCIKSSFEEKLPEACQEILTKSSEFIEKNVCLMEIFHPELNQSENLGRQLDDHNIDHIVRESISELVSFECYLGNVFDENGQFTRLIQFSMHCNEDNEFARTYEKGLKADRNELDFSPESLKKIFDKFISQVEDAMIKAETKLEKQQVFREFLVHIFWLVGFKESYVYKYAFPAGHHLDELKALLYRAAETDAELWVYLAKLERRHENFDKAKEILNKAVKKIPNSERLWLNISYNESERSKRRNVDKVQETIDRALIFFADNDFVIDKAKWIEATYGFRRAEQVTQALAISIFGIYDENEIGLSKDTDSFKKYERYVRIHMVQAFPKRRHIWIEAIFHEDTKYDDLRCFFKTACIERPDDVNLRNLIQAIKKLNSDEYAAAQRLFNKVNIDLKWKDLVAEKYSQFQDKIKKLRSNRHDKYKLLKELDISDGKAIEDVKYHHYPDYIQNYLIDEWLLGEHKLVQEVFAKAVIVHSEYENWSIKGQIETELGKLDQAAETFENAIKSLNCTYRFDLCLKLAELEERRGDLLRAENVLELGISRAKKYVRKVPLWIAGIRLKLRINKKTEAQTLLAQAIEEHPKSGELWAETISIEERSERGKKVAEGLKQFEDYSYEVKHVMLATAKYFFSRGDIKKSRKWFNKTIELYSSNYRSFGDTWFYYYKLEKIYGTEESAREVLIRCIVTSFDDEALFGEKWKTFKDHIDNWGLTVEELLEAIVKPENIDIKDI